MDRFVKIMESFPAWKEERLPPPRTNQSEVGLPSSIDDFGMLTAL
jgi:hypothetical protein